MFVCILYFSLIEENNFNSYIYNFNSYIYLSQVEIISETYLYFFHTLKETQVWM